MTTQQLYLFNALYLVILVVVVWLTRPTPRRLVGALTGGTVSGLVCLGMIALGEAAGWWHMAIAREVGFLGLFLLDLFLSLTPVFLITWRIARRFGGRGLLVVVAVSAVLGPIRDDRYMKMFPEWGAYGPGMAPRVAVAVTYVLVFVVGHAIMAGVAGPAQGSALARWPWDRPVPPA